MIETDIRGHGFEYYFNEQLEFNRLTNQEMYFKSLSGMSIDEAIGLMRQGYKMLWSKNDPKGESE